MSEPPPGIFARGIGIGFALQVAGAGLAFVLQLCLARWLGAAAYGTYAFVLAWSGILAIAAGLGLPTLVLRALPGYSVHKDWRRVSGLVTTALAVTALVGAVLALLGITLVLTFGWQTNVSVIGFVMVPLLTLMALLQEMVRSFRHIALAYGPSLVLRPCLIIFAAGTHRRLR